MSREKVADDFDQPEATAVWRLLDRAVEQGLVLREGSGKKNDPFRYWMAERVEVWKQDPLYEMIEAQKASLKLPFESLAEWREKLRQVGGIGGGGSAERE